MQSELRSIIHDVPIVDDGDCLHLSQRYLESSESAKATNQISLGLLVFQARSKMYQIVHVCVGLTSSAVIN